jgi:hypothetical protein
MLRKILVGFVWYLIIVNMVAFLATFAISLYLAAMGSQDAQQQTMVVYMKYQWAAILVSVLITVIGVVKGILPWTKIRVNAEVLSGESHLATKKSMIVKYFEIKCPACGNTLSKVKFSIGKARMCGFCNSKIVLKLKFKELLIAAVGFGIICAILNIFVDTTYLSIVLMFLYLPLTIKYVYHLKAVPDESKSSR